MKESSEKKWEKRENKIRELETSGKFNQWEEMVPN